MRACPSAALAETVASVATLGGSSPRRCRAVLGTLYCFALAVNVRSVVGTFRLRLLLLVRCRLSGLGGLREERSEQGGREHNDGHESAHRAHSPADCLLKLRVGSSNYLKQSFQQPRRVHAIVSDAGDVGLGGCRRRGKRWANEKTLPCRGCTLMYASQPQTGFFSQLT